MGEVDGMMILKNIFLNLFLNGYLVAIMYPLDLSPTNDLQGIKVSHMSYLACHWYERHF
jgi:hypothetical protein